MSHELRTPLAAIIGIESDARARLFTPFEQADNSMTCRFGGTGLGLAICKQLVQMMGGQIGVRSVGGDAGARRPARGTGRRRCAGDGNDPPAPLYALILMDMQMPHMNGTDAARNIRAETLNGRTPILALTANAFEEDRRA